MERNLEQLLRTKRYRALQKLYGKVSDPIHALEKKEVLSDEETQKLNHLKTVSYTHLAQKGTAHNGGYSALLWHPVPCRRPRSDASFFPEGRQDHLTVHL